MGSAQDPLPDNRAITLAATFLALTGWGEAAWTFDSLAWRVTAISLTRLGYRAHRYSLEGLPICRAELGRKILRVLTPLRFIDHRGRVRGVDVGTGKERDILLNFRAYAARQQETAYAEKMVEDLRAAWRRPRRARGGAR